MTIVDERTAGFMPRLTVTVRLEGTPRFYLGVAFAEDEESLRGCLARVADELATRIAEQLLDAIESEAA